MTQRTPETAEVEREVKCPCCKGTGKSLLSTCAWCAGAGSVSVETVHKYADVIEMLGRGGYIAGDHNWDDCQRMCVEATEIREGLNDVQA